MRKADGLSYSRLRELLLDKIKKFGFDPTLSGMRSLCGAAAANTANTGVQERLFLSGMATGNQNGYVTDSAQRRLEVSKSLGI